MRRSPSTKISLVDLAENKEITKVKLVSCRNTLCYSHPLCTPCSQATTQSLISHLGSTVTLSSKMLPCKQVLRKYQKKDNLIKRIQEKEKEKDYPSLTVTLSMMMQLMIRTLSSMWQFWPRTECLIEHFSDSWGDSPMRQSAPTYKTKITAIYSISQFSLLLFPYLTLRRRRSRFLTGKQWSLDHLWFQKRFKWIRLTNNLT